MTETSNFDHTVVMICSISYPEVSYYLLWCYYSTVCQLECTRKPTPSFQKFQSPRYTQTRHFQPESAFCTSCWFSVGSHESFFFRKKIEPYLYNSIDLNSKRNKQCKMFCPGGNSFCITGGFCITQFVIVSDHFGFWVLQILSKCFCILNKLPYIINY